MPATKRKPNNLTSFIPAHDRDAVRDAVRQERRRRELAEAAMPHPSLREFIPGAWAIIEPQTTFVPNYHIDAICEHLEAISRGQLRNLIINIPPRCMKSNIVAVAWPAWEWTESPHIKFLFASYAQQLSIRDSVATRRIIESIWYQSNWGSLFQLTGDQNEKTRFENSQRGFRLATSVGGLSTGEGADRITVDDPHNVKKSLSDTQRTEALTWWDLSMSTRLNDPKKSSKVIIMQRLDARDLTGHMLADHADEYDHLCLPMRYEPKKTVILEGGAVKPECHAGLAHDPRTEPGELLWPARFGEPEVRQLEKSLGEYGASGQLQQRPSPIAGAILKRHQWQYWQRKGQNLPPVEVLYDNPDTHAVETLLIEPVTLPDLFDELIQSWDCTFKDEKAAKSGKPDYVVGQVQAFQAQRAIYIIDQVRDRLDLPGTIRAVQGLTAKWPTVVTKLVEDKANGPAVIAMLKGTIAGLLPVQPDGTKTGRAQGAAPLLEAHMVFLPHPLIAEWVPGFIEEATAFPNGANDDQVDVFTQGVKRWRELRVIEGTTRLRM